MSDTIVWIVIGGLIGASTTLVSVVLYVGTLMPDQNMQISVELVVATVAAVGVVGAAVAAASSSRSAAKAANNMLLPRIVFRSTTKADREKRFTGANEIDRNLRSNKGIVVENIGNGAALKVKIYVSRGSNDKVEMLVDKTEGPKWTLRRMVVGNVVYYPSRHSSREKGDPLTIFTEHFGEKGKKMWVKVTYQDISEPPRNYTEEDWIYDI